MPNPRPNLLDPESYDSFIGRPLRVLGKVNCFSRKGFMLLLDDRGNTFQICNNLNLNLLLRTYFLMDNIGYCDHVIEKIENYYGRINITIRPGGRNERK